MINESFISAHFFSDLRAEQYELEKRSNVKIRKKHAKPKESLSFHTIMLELLF